MSVAIVTGAANGIGRAVAERLRDDGFTVVGLDIEPITAQGIAAEHCDVASIEGHEQLVATDIGSEMPATFASATIGPCCCSILATSCS